MLILYMSLTYILLLLNLTGKFSLERPNNGIRANDGPCIESFPHETFKQICLVMMNDNTSKDHH